MLRGLLRSRCRLVLLAAACGCVTFGFVAPSFGQAPKTTTKAKKLPEPEELDLTTSDGVEIKGIYLPGSRGKDSVPVVLLHMWKGSGGEYDALALTLQRAGHAVIIPDLRGHGDSVTKRGKGPEMGALDQIALRPADFKNMVQYDMETIKSFLLEQNNEGRLNVEKLVIVGAEMGASVALQWAVIDYSWQQLPAYKQGRDLKALVLISPRFAFKGLSAKTALSNEFVKRDLSVMLVVGSEDKESARDARSIHKMLERSHPLPEDERDLETEQDLFLIELPTSLQGTKILKEKQMGVDKLIAQFIDVRVAEQSFPWTDRTNPLDR